MFHIFLAAGVILVEVGLPDTLPSYFLPWSRHGRLGHGRLGHGRLAVKVRDSLSCSLSLELVALGHVLDLLVCEGLLRLRGVAWAVHVCVVHHGSLRLARFLLMQVVYEGVNRGGARYSICLEEGLLRSLVRHNRLHK